MEIQFYVVCVVEKRQWCMNGFQSAERADYNYWNMENAPRDDKRNSLLSVERASTALYEI